MSDPRRLAFDVIRAVTEQDAYANLELGRLLRERRVSARDAAFATELVSGTLRLQGSYDLIIDHLVTRRLDPAVRDVLRLGAHQVLSMRVPTHAAVATTVSLTRSAVGHKVSGLVNAVLRRVAARSLEEWFDRLDASLAVRTSHPEWVVSSLATALGERSAELPDLLAADNERPTVTLVARPGLATVEELVGEGAQALPISPLAAVLPGGDPGALAAVREGRAGVQDAGSQLVALATAAASVDSDSRWLDLCAGPGGKAALSSALAATRGAVLLASERAPHRAALVRSAGVPRVIAADGTRPAWGPVFDRVLADVPCSGLGALRRRPESRWRRTPSDVSDLVPLQRALLASALDSTRPGGVVGYATCSPVVAETAEVVRAVLDSRDDSVLEPVPPLLPWVADCESAILPGALQLWPHRHGTDAMFLALLRKR